MLMTRNKPFGRPALIPCGSSSLRVLTLLLFACSHAFGDETNADSPDRFAVSDYALVRRIAEVALSSDGLTVAYVVETPSLERNTWERRTVIQPLSTKSRVRTCEVPVLDAHNLAWIPGTLQLAFLTGTKLGTEVVAYNCETKAQRRWTDGKDHVMKFRFSPNGRMLAVIRKPTPSPKSSLYVKLRTKDSGLLIDPDFTTINDFINPLWDGTTVDQRTLWFGREQGELRRIEVPGDPTEFFWSSDSSRLSVTYVGDDASARIYRLFHTSLGIAHLGTGRFSPIARAREHEKNHFVYFSGGEWIQRENKLVIRRTVETDPWVSRRFPQWAVSSSSGFSSEQDLAWSVFETYDDEPNVIPLTARALLIENTTEAVRNLFLLSGGISSPSDLVGDIGGSNSSFSFSGDLSVVAFVHETLATPPELYVKQLGGEPRRVTAVNRAISHKRLTSARALSWASDDGSKVSGWLLQPDRADAPPPWPLITLVHGGPAYAFPNSFIPTAAFWPYPIEAFASAGIAVFIPNYRGTPSFGRIFQTPSQIDREPVDDILAGLSQLLADGIADGTRLGMIGHSHGAWLGPLVMTRKNIFRAGSFAEGVANKITMYEVMSGQLNEEVHDIVNGVGLYDSPERYIALSPDLHFKGLSAAMMFESGAESQAIPMLGYGKAARRFDIPVESIVYPKTGHSLRTPRLQEESRERNFDWFLFWLKDQEDKKVSKVSQYARWRALRDQEYSKRLADDDIGSSK